MLVNYGADIDDFGPWSNNMGAIEFVLELLKKSQKYEDDNINRKKNLEFKSLLRFLINKGANLSVKTCLPGKTVNDIINIFSPDLLGKKTNNFGKKNKINYFKQDMLYLKNLRG